MSAPGNNINEGGEDASPVQQEASMSQQDQHEGPPTSRAPTLAGDHEDVQPPGLEITEGRGSTERQEDPTQARSGESARRFPLVDPSSEGRRSGATPRDSVTAENERSTSPQPSQRELRLARLSTISGRTLDLDQLFHIRESVQLSIEDPAMRVSSGRPSHQEGVASSTHTLTHGEIPDEVDAFSRLHHHHHHHNDTNDTHNNPSQSSSSLNPPGTRTTFSIHDEKKLQRNGNSGTHTNNSMNRSASFSSVDFSEEETIVAWEEKDPENPYNWPSRKKSRILTTAVMLILNSTMGSALPSNAIPFIVAEFGVVDRGQRVLPISVYLIGYVMGPILWGPLSEQYGRKILSVGTFAMFSLSTLACALAPTWASFLVFRLLAGVFASAPLAIVTGIIADMYSDPRIRGRSMGIFMVSTVFGPLLAPIISGFCATSIGWRWSFWIALMYAGLTMIPLIFMPETFSPVLLLRRARSIRAHNPSAKIVAPHELEKKNLTELTTVVLTRPIRMIIFEPIVNTSCAYLALCYAIFYMSFEAFPTIFQGVYGLSPGLCGLTYLSIGVGALLALPVFFTYDNILSRARARNASWTHQEEYRRLPLACIGGPMFVISLFWLGWTSRPEVPMIVPILAGIPFGLGFMCVFQALLNYLTDAYEIFAASAHAAASTSRSLLATVLPLAAGPMFARLGISGACSLLGGLSMIMCFVPFFFLWQGDRIRANSGFCIALRERKEEMARKIEEQAQRRKRVRMTVGSTTSSSGDEGMSGSGGHSGSLDQVVTGVEASGIRVVNEASGSREAVVGVERTEVERKEDV